MSGDMQIAIRAEVEERGWPGLRGCDGRMALQPRLCHPREGKERGLRQVARAAVHE